MKTIILSIIVTLAIGCKALSTSNRYSTKTMIQQQLQQSLTGKMILAPLTRGGNLPFRRLCADFGMDVSLSEMIMLEAY